MITKKGNLLTAFANGEVNTIVHGCNCFHTMGAGIAGQIAKLYPGAFDVDKTTPYGDIRKLGTYSLFTTPDNGDIINAYTQFKPGKENPYYLYASIEEVFRQINFDFANKTIGIPRIGAGIAGGNWNTIFNIIAKVAPNVNIIVYYMD